MQAHLKISFILSLIIIILSTIAAAGGLFITDLYFDSDTIKTVWQGNDLVTLAVVVPLLIVALVFSRRGGERAFLVWMGLLAYMIYNYAFYLFGAAFNSFFLLYVVIFSLSIYALVLGLSGVDVNIISKKFSDKTPIKLISIFLLFISLPLAFAEVSQCINYIITGKVPEAPSLIFALDLSMVVPNTALSAILLWKHSPWGYVLAAMMLVKAFSYGLVLSVGTALIAFNPAGKWDPLMPFYVFVAAGGLIGSIVRLYNLKPPKL